MRIDEKRILVVDDDDAIRTLLFTVLRRRGLKVDTARNGVEAAQSCMRCRYAVMLLDLMMPGLSGYDVLERIEQMPAEERPFVIVLTAGHEPRHLNPEIVAGTVRKPFDIELLLDTVLACMTTLRALEQREGCPPAESDEQRGNAPN